MPVLSIIAIGFLTLSLTAGLTIAALPLGILQHQGWFPETSEISLWLLLLTCGLFGFVLAGLRSDDRFSRLTTTGGSALLVVGLLLGIEVLLIQGRRPGAPGILSLWGLFLGCTVLGVIGVYAAEKAREMERQAEKERAQEMERQAQAACAEERLRGSLRFGRRSVRR